MDNMAGRPLDEASCSEAYWSRSHHGALGEAAWAFDVAHTGDDDFVAWWNRVKALDDRT